MVFSATESEVAQVQEAKLERLRVPFPNCTALGLAITLEPLADAFGLTSAIVTTMQGLSGAGRSPWVIAMEDLVDGSEVLPVRRLPDDGLEAWDLVQTRGDEGPVAKDPRGAYRPGRTTSWRKVKRPVPENRRGGWR